MSKFSKEYLFRECVLHHHCILLHLSKGVLWDDRIIYDINMTDINLIENEQKQLFDNWANTINTYGSLDIKAFAPNESPLEAILISLSTDNIIDLELYNNTSV